MILLLLLAGAVINVAVAFACYRWIDHVNMTVSTTSGYRWPPPPTWIETTRQRKFGREIIEKTHYTYRGRWKTGDGDLPTARTLSIEDRYGMPLPALSRSLAFEASLWRKDEPPSQIVWHGFVANTLFYAMLLALAAWVLPMTRIIRRSMRGQCVHCGYGLQGHFAAAGRPNDDLRCPECGRHA